VRGSSLIFRRTEEKVEGGFSFSSPVSKKELSRKEEGVRFRMEKTFLRKEEDG